MSKTVALDISFLKNFDLQHTLRCGIEHAEGDCIISMDGDLQHPPILIPELIKKRQEGYSILYTQRTEEQGTSRFRKITSTLFYCLINSLSDVNIEQGSAHFRLIWASVLVSVLFIGGMLLLFLRILRENLEKLFMQTKQRPGYIIKKSFVYARS